MPRPALLGPTVAHVVFLTVASVLSVFKPWGPVRSPHPHGGPDSGYGERINAPNPLEEDDHGDL